MSESSLIRPPYYVITGASGAGKSTLIAALAAHGHQTVPEAALALLKEQQASNSDILPGKNRQAFMQALLARNLDEYRRQQGLSGPVFFDRGIPECIAWMRMMALKIPAELLGAAAACPYARRVFVAEPWPEIYVSDSERPFSFERAQRSFAATVAGYSEAGYELCVLPRASVQERAAFVLAHIAETD